MAGRTGSLAAPRTSLRREGVFRALVAALAIAATTGASSADSLAEAQAAFEQERYERAAEIWRGLARTGEPEAAFRLGLISDLGLGRAPDTAVAFSRYLEAANRGHATAQFNVGVMLDAGTGPIWSPSAAAIWYARAAAKGFARAEYNLALLYAEADGLPENIALARAWMNRAAASLPAALERLETLRASASAVERPAAPAPLAAATVSAPGVEPTLELVWTATEQPFGTRYRVEFDGADGVTAPAAADGIEVSAIVLPLPSGEPRRWRVLAIDGEHVAASDWQPLAGGRTEPPFERRIAIRVRSDDAQALAFAAEITRDFARSGLDVETLAVEDTEIVESEVRYFSDEDALLAREVAAVMPVLAGQTVFRPDTGREPGTVEVRLRGGPGS